MGQLGFYDLSQRYEGLDHKNDLLVALAQLVLWETFRGKLNAALSQHGLRTASEDRKGPAGRKPGVSVAEPTSWRARCSDLNFVTLRLGVGECRANHLERER